MPEPRKILHESKTSAVFCLTRAISSVNRKSKHTNNHTILYNYHSYSSKSWLDFRHQTFQVHHVYCNFILGYICRITANFRTLKDGSLQINIFESKNYFSDRNIFQNDVDALSKIDDAFSAKKKNWKFYLLRIIPIIIKFC